MNRFEWAKIPAAIVGAILLVFVAQLFGYAFYQGTVFQDQKNRSPVPVYEVEGVSPFAGVQLADWQRDWPAALASNRDREQLAAFMKALNTEPEKIVVATASTGGGNSGPKVVIPLPNLLANADLAAGEKQARKCVTCHNLEKGGSNDQGPALWGIIGSQRATVSGFDYTEAMTTLGGEWTLDSIYEYLVNPRKYVPGTNMSFAGIRKDEPRANLVAYLRTLSDSPVPLPDPVEMPEEVTDATDAQ